LPDSHDKEHTDAESGRPCPTTGLAVLVQSCHDFAVAAA
jgi:hypothetical protein